ncbi:GyrI-like domain-containing protein [Paractinoplanes brasiliensis]|uniref:Effector-binding domain-containing protein n=1 Tax=Paractinoplanes brasiliensis TaxID=52695 RepID=A0A4R6K069_9ACTN|nr:GyrI-like domain-containing protein [Actinoplanes brasiliensis]TDO41592.1 effector-binding domain-containing protein [Actinoplanes brasiliensis]GID27121.1 DNA gyrase inhibitor [Actinoplanes brasiliensis]
MEPTIVELGEQPYVGRRESITMTRFARVADHLPAMFARLGERGVPVAGAPFLRYRVIDMSADLVVEAGIPITGPARVAPPLFVESLPAGRYVTTSHIGHPDGLMQVTARLLDWAYDRGLEFDMHPTPTGEVWGCRLEVLRTDPAEEPDMHRWRTDLFLKLAA